MHAMQYEISLPADYDMNIIRHRVETRGALLDAHPGLGLKAYAIRRRGIAGSPVNQYAPFYLWNSVAEMNAFLLGEGFSGLCDSFGRPAVHHWVGLSFQPGPGFGEVPRAASRSTIRLNADDDVANVVTRLLSSDRLTRRRGLHSTALAWDVARWELVRFSLWQDDPADAEVQYEVLHLSAPEGLALAG